MTKYREGDLVTIRLDKADAQMMNKYPVDAFEIVKHEPAPEPLVYWTNIYEGGTSYTVDTEENADDFAALYNNVKRIAKLKVTIIGDDVKAEVIKQTTNRRK